VKAFVPPGWVAQEALRLELYRRISLAPDHATLDQIRTETLDRYGALPDEVETLFAIASLRVSARALGVEEISTFRDQVRLKPVAIDEALLTDLEERVYGSTYAPESQTLNLVPERVFGKDLVAFVERWLLEAATGDAVLPAPAPAG
jgi:transcription-repair coupling factor (superfamily II helicase)